MENNVDLDQQASEKSADQDLQFSKYDLSRFSMFSVKLRIPKITVQITFKIVLKP